MTRRAQLANGDILEFPDETPDAVMDRVVQEHISSSRPDLAALRALDFAKTQAGLAGQVQRVPRTTLSDVLGGVGELGESASVGAGQTAGGLLGAAAGQPVAGAVLGGMGTQALIDAMRASLGGKQKSLGESLTGLAGAGVTGAGVGLGAKTAAAAPAVAANELRQPLSFLERLRFVPLQRQAQTEVTRAQGAAIGPEKRMSMRAAFDAINPQREAGIAENVAARNAVSMKGAQEKAALDLAKQQSRIELSQQISAVRAGGDAAEAIATNRAKQQADQMVAKVGQQMTAMEKTVMAPKVRQAGYDTLTARSSEISDQLLPEIANRNMKTVKVLTPARTLGKAGEKLMVPVDQEIAMPVTTPLEELKPSYDKVKMQLKFAAANSNPGAEALVQIYEGPKQVGAETALNQLSALNAKGGWNNADPIVRKAGQAIARQTAHIYNKAIDAAAQDLPEADRIQFTALRDEQRRLLQGRSQLFETKPAKAAIGSVEKYGDFGRLANNPAAVEAYWKIATPELQQGLKNDMIRKINTGNFAKNWEGLSDAIKTTIFDKNEITNGDALAKSFLEDIPGLRQEYVGRMENVKSLAGAKQIAIEAQRKAVLPENLAQRQVYTAQIAGIKQRTNSSMQQATRDAQDAADAARQNVARTRYWDRRDFLQTQQTQKRTAAFTGLLKSVGKGATLGAGASLAWRHRNIVSEMLGGSP